MLLILGRRMEQMKPLKLMAIACLMTGLRILLTGSGVLALMLFAQLLQSVTYMLMYYCGVMCIGRYVPEKLQSSGQSLLVLVQSGCGSMIGAVAGGRLIDAAGMQAAFAGYASLTILGTLAVSLVLWKRMRKERSFS